MSSSHVRDLASRAQLHRLLGDERRLAIVDELRRSDRTPSELGELVGTGSNLLAHHLDELERSGVVRRVRSEGDGRRRYVQLHRLLGDERRLAIVDELRRSDRTPSELGELVGTSSNLLAHHLDELERSGVVRRVRSEGDGRRRYVQLLVDPLVLLGSASPVAVDGQVLFVCTHNAARSQLAAALWRERTGGAASSAGTEPADRVADGARAVARRHGLRLDDRPRHVDEVDADVGLVVTVCDRARETGGWPEAPDRHWSVPDPVGRPGTAYEAAYDRLATWIDRLSAEVGP